MSNRPGSPLFLARRSYRFRRLMDAVRLLPVLALALWMVPLLWPVPDTGADPEITTSHTLRYIFGVWLGMILLALFLWRRTARKIAQENQS
ncbi:hypothetical protein SAMN04488040_0487 [Sulfitobacter marinus]|uniref:Uncharacterized protein n=1 Tax=Sulfitobacter marinus TaxID=394264 RepID=A0A1I6Q441_9RHOB|nr:hypothetical protein [Sulfitobacter marinus]SFS47217.1 hypothetical protein SAMN04488040_0487 [Sulfitobacter marinus]